MRICLLHVAVLTIIFKRLILFLVVMGLSLSLYTPFVLGSGFEIFEHGAKAAGMGAFTGKSDDPSAVFFNPAGINQLNDTNLAIGTILIPLTLTFNSSSKGNKTEVEDHLLNIPHLYLTHEITDRTSIGFGIFSPFGLMVDWPNDWEGRFLTTFAELKTIFFNPVISFKITPNLSIAGGIEYVYSEAWLENRIDFSSIPLPEGDISLDSKGDGFGWNLGILIHITEKNSIGFSYRSPVKLDLNGDARFNVNPLLAPLFPNGKGSTEIDLPPLATIGLTSRSIDDLTIALDLHWTGWNRFNEIKIDLENNTPAATDIVMPRNWDNSFMIIIGAEYQATSALYLRGSYIFDKSPVPDETLDPIIPDADRNAFGLGAGYRWYNLTIDLAYIGTFFKDRNIPDSTIIANNPRGEIEAFISLIALDLSYRF